MDKRVRSPNYPALSLPDALSKVAAVYRELHTHAAPREVVAKAMGYSGLSGASATSVSALHKYGLLEKAGNDEIRVSERAMSIMHPHSPEEKAKAVREAAVEPVLFAELSERFPGKIPNEELLRNYLVRKGFASSAVSSVILAFRETSEMVERENVGYAESEQPHEPTAMTTQAFAPVPRTQATPFPAQPVEMTRGDRTVSRYDYEGGGYVRISVGGEIDTDEALDMVETLVSLKRAELKRKAKMAIHFDGMDIHNQENESTPHSEIDF
jgi:hypothetical protein